MTAEEPIFDYEASVIQDGIQAHLECFDAFPEEIEDGRE
jgi:hypothetical protein